jgi:phage gpG-like protein
VKPLIAAYQNLKTQHKRSLAALVIETAEVGYGEIQKRLRGPVLRYRSGNLSRSVTRTIRIKQDKTIARLEAGSAAVPYAAIHENGGVIQGKPWLRIPLTREGRVRRPGDYITKGGAIKRGEAVVAVLRRSVRIPKRPFVEPSAQAAWRYFLRELPRRLEV